MVLSSLAFFPSKRPLFGLWRWDDGESSFSGSGWWRPMLHRDGYGTESGTGNGKTKN
ncbi:unnamed protein product, partial [Brassica oleracea]